MAANPYDEDELKRQSQIGMLRDPVSTTMPIGGAPQMTPTPITRGEPSAGVGLVNGPAPSGWDAGNWSDPNMHSVKYDTERLLYGKNKPSEVAAAVRDQSFQQRFPGATFNGKDWIDFGGILSDGDRGEPVHGIDFLKGANPETDTSEGHWWGAPDSSGSPSAHKTGGPNPLMDNSAITRILAELSAASNDDQSPAEREAVLQMLQGGI